MKINTSSKLLIGFGVQVLLTGVLGVNVLLGMADMQKQFQFVVVHDAPVIANARQLSKLVVDMETGQRGFLITGLDEYLEPYNTGAKEFDELMLVEKQLVSDNHSQILALHRIERLVSSRSGKCWLPNQKSILPGKLSPVWKSMGMLYRRPMLRTYFRRVRESA